MKKLIFRIICAAVILALYIFIFAVVPSKSMSDFDYCMAYDNYCISAILIQIPAGCLISGLIGGFAYSRHGIWSLGFAAVSVLSVVLSVLIHFSFYDSYLLMLIYPAVIAVSFVCAMIIKRWATKYKRTDGSGFKWRWI